MKRSIVTASMCACCLLAVSAPGRAAYFDGMEAYRQNDYQTALREFKSDEGSEKALYMVGVMYEKGEGLTLDYAEAAQWYRKSADKGYSPAQYRLGRLYERGLGVDQNRDEAIKLYKKSAKQGSVDARQALKRMDAK